MTQTILLLPNIFLLWHLQPVTLFDKASPHRYRIVCNKPSHSYWTYSYHHLYLPKHYFSIKIAFCTNNSCCQAWIDNNFIKKRTKPREKYICVIFKTTESALNGLKYFCTFQHWTLKPQHWFNHWATPTQTDPDHKPGT